MPLVCCRQVLGALPQGEVGPKQKTPGFWAGGLL